MSENNFFADFHCHPTLRALNTTPSSLNRNLWDKTYNYTSNTPIARWARLQTKEIAKESQMNFYACAENNTRVIFDSLYPVEKGWFKFRKMPSYIMSNKAREEIMLVAFGIEKKRLKNLLAYECYFPELEECYEFLLKGQGPSPDGKYAYKLVGNYSQLEDVIKNQNNCLAVIVNIEGAHALECGVNYTKKLKLQEHKNLLTENIKKVKEWEFPPFSVNLAHHFWNQLCGHVRSMKPPINLVFDQMLGVDLGINELGWHVVEELLSAKNGKRILIDTKHMSVKARLEYYKYINDYNKVNPKDKIPVICSHSGVNGFETMADSKKMIDNRRKLRGSYYNNWGINLSNEEIRIIHHSGGMIGIMMDKGLLGSPDTVKHIGKIPNPQTRKNAFLKLALDNIFSIVRAVGNKSGWDIITLGSDYDGLITHIDCYENAGSIGSFKKDLVEYLNFTKYRRELWYGLSPEELTAKVFSSNLMSFLKVNFK